MKKKTHIPLLIPIRESLVEQTANALRAGIKNNTWHEWLPGERTLSRALQVGRNTLRKAVAALEKEGVLQVSHPYGTRILAARAGETRNARRRARTIGLLMPTSMSELRPKVSVAINNLRELLAEKHYRLHLFTGRQYFTPGASLRLRRLVSSNSQDCWILFQAQKRTKLWFLQNKIPTIALGTSEDSIRLPFIDLDYRKITFHATTRLMELGHERIALMLHKPLRGGDFASIEGFQDGLAAAKKPSVKGRILRFSSPKESMMLHEFERLLEKVPRPTAIIVPHPYSYLLMMTHLREKGYALPRDMSLICRSDDIFLDYLVPRPARYRFNSSDFSGGLFDLVVRTLRGETDIFEKSVLIMPRYESGEMIAPPR